MEKYYPLSVSGEGNPFWTKEIRMVERTEFTCPPPNIYFKLDGNLVTGCGGYGEVSKNHPGRSEYQLTADENDGYCCGVCHGTGLFERKKMTRPIG